MSVKAVAFSLYQPIGGVIITEGCIKIMRLQEYEGDCVWVQETILAALDLITEKPQSTDSVFQFMVKECAKFSEAYELPIIGERNTNSILTEYDIERLFPEAKILPDYAFHDWLREQL